MPKRARCTRILWIWFIEMYHNTYNISVNLEISQGLFLTYFKGIMAGRIIKGDKGECIWEDDLCCGDQGDSVGKYNWYLAVQDGMEIDEIEKVMDRFDGIFVGGTVKWKVRTGEEWVRLAHAHNLPCHIGRVGVFRRIIWARRINADSIDSTSFIWKPNGFEILDSAKAQTLLEIIQ